MDTLKLGALRYIYSNTACICSFCLDPIPRETYAEHWAFDTKTSPWTNPLHPLTCVANVIWLIFFGWEIVLLFWLTAIIQALTVIGIGTALQMFELSLFAL